MSAIKHQVVTAQRRLWLNRWLRHWGWALVLAAGLWLLAWLVDRLFLPNTLPKAEMAFSAAVLSILAAIITLICTKENRLAAAAILDDAAGLQERLSTSFCVPDRPEDVFVQAVVADAERVASGLTARRFIPIRWGRSLSYAVVMLGIATFSLLLPEFDLINRRTAANPGDARAAELNRVQAVVSQSQVVMREIEKRNPDLADQNGRKFNDARLRDNDPEVLRRETQKKLDRLQEGLKLKAAAERFKALNETKNKLKELGVPSNPQSELGLLTEALSEGDYKQAQEALKKVQEELAKRAREGKMDAQKLEQMQKQMNELAEKLQKAAGDKQSQRELQNAGLSKEEAQRVLEALSKKDPKQLEKMARELVDRLKSQGMTEKQIQELLQKCQQRQEASKSCQQLGQKMSQCAQKLEAGNFDTAQNELAEAGQQLSEMEQLEQELNDLQSQMSDLSQQRENLNQDSNRTCEKCNGSGYNKDGSPCAACGGTGRFRGNGKGNGMGDGQGTGTRSRDDTAQTKTIDRKAPSQTRKDGSVIGQQFVKGKMLTGKSDAEFVDAAYAAEVDATDSLDKERIPRLYRKAVKKYFDRLGGGSGEKKTDPNDNDPQSNDEPKK